MSDVDFTFAIPEMRRINNIHLVGIGGTGMSGIAEVLLNLGYSIGGSDIRESDTTARLRELGVVVAIGHRPENLMTADVVVYSATKHIDGQGRAWVVVF